MVSDLIPMWALTQETRVVSPMPDVAVAAIPLLQQLRDTLLVAGRFREGYRRHAARSSRIWNEPPLFFFQQAQSRASSPESESESESPPQASSPQERHRDPVGAAAWAALPHLLDDALSVLASSVTARHTARAVTGLVTAAESLQTEHPHIRQLVEVLAVLDDAVLVIVHPEARAGWRVVVSGVTDVGQLQILLAEEWRDHPAPMPLSGSRPSHPTVAACPDPAASSNQTVESHFQLYQSVALTADGTVPGGLAGVEHWLWPGDALAAIPRVQGERILLLGEPVYPLSWPAVRRAPLVQGRLTVLERYSPSQVTHWLEARIGRSLPVSRLRQAA